MKIVGIIPARYASTRFPGKPLSIIGKKTVIEMVWKNLKNSKKISRAIIATDDRRIFNYCKNFGAEVMMTSKNHRTGTERIAEVARKIKPDIIINLQGDEPFILPKDIEKMIECMLNEDRKTVVTAAVPINEPSEITDPNSVKVVCDKSRYALYFSRSPIPFNSNSVLKHIGVYLFYYDFLLMVVKMKPTPLELAENLEQLRILENGYKIKIVKINHPTIAIDIPKDIIKANNYLREGGSKILKAPPK